MAGILNACAIITFTFSHSARCQMGRAIVSGCKASYVCVGSNWCSSRVSNKHILRGMPRACIEVDSMYDGIWETKIKTSRTYFEYYSQSRKNFVVQY